MEVVVSVVKDLTDNETSGKAAAALRVAHCLSTSANPYTLRHLKTDIFANCKRVAPNDEAKTACKTH